MCMDVYLCVRVSVIRYQISLEDYSTVYMCDVCMCVCTYVCMCGSVCECMCIYVSSEYECVCVCVECVCGGKVSDLAVRLVQASQAAS